MSDDFARLRTEYSTEGLDAVDLAPDPAAMFRIWFEQATVLPEPNAMVIATVSEQGQPSSRTVLLKGLDERGFVFFTNLQSHKGSELAGNPKCALLFPWHPLQRQIRIEGTAHLLDRNEVTAYFSTRPRGAQLGAWASPQSRVVDAAELATRFADAELAMPDPISAPEHWGGYVVVPDRVEFWQGRLNRMHDRWRYRRDDAGEWRTERLAP